MSNKQGTGRRWHPQVEASIQAFSRQRKNDADRVKLIEAAGQKLARVSALWRSYGALASFTTVEKDGPASLG